MKTAPTVASTALALTYATLCALALAGCDVKYTPDAQAPPAYVATASAPTGEVPRSAPPAWVTAQPTPEPAPATPAPAPAPATPAAPAAPAAVQPAPTPEGSHEVNEDGGYVPGSAPIYDVDGMTIQLDGTWHDSVTGYDGCMEAMACDQSGKYEALPAYPEGWPDQRTCWVNLLDTIVCLTEGTAP